MFRAQPHHRPGHANTLIILRLLLALAALVFVERSAFAVEAVRVSPQSRAIDLTSSIERYASTGDLIQISTAPGRDGIVRRIAVKARESGSSPGWLAFALTNSSEEQLERILAGLQKPAT